MRSDAVLERLTRLHPKLIDLSLERIERLLAALGHPERQLPPVVHVAGTNGKGSTIAFLQAICEAAGLSAHVYVSPHLIRFNERIAVRGRPIGEEPLNEVLAACEEANGGEPITFFEITTAAAFLAFSRVPADIALIETGLGGRFDATNVLAAPALSVITPVSRDHVHFLGETVPEIAFEKAGILKPGIPAVIGPQEPGAADVIAARAAEIGTPLLRHGVEWRGNDPDYRDGKGTLNIPPPGLIGPHQLENAGIAAAAARALGWPALDERAIRAGIASARWPGRLQRLEGGPLSARLGPGRELWVDGGHNRAAGEALARVAEGWSDRPLHLVMGTSGGPAVRRLPRAACRRDRKLSRRARAGRLCLPPAGAARRGRARPEPEGPFVRRRRHRSRRHRTAVPRPGAGAGLRLPLPRRRRTRGGGRRSVAPLSPRTCSGHPRLAAPRKAPPPLAGEAGWGTAPAEGEARQRPARDPPPTPPTAPHHVMPGPQPRITRVMVEGRPSTFCFSLFRRPGHRKKLVDGRPSPTMTV